MRLCVVLFTVLQVGGALSHDNRRQRSARAVGILDFNRVFDRFPRDVRARIIYVDAALAAAVANLGV